MSGDLCFIVDSNIAWLKYPLKRRGFIVYAPVEDYPEGASDRELLEWASKLGCVVVSTDAYFSGKSNAVYVPHYWLQRYNSWDLVTKIIKTAALRSTT